ncbi:endonuclease domain-containing protein [Mycolicibacterium rhodesiae]|uniref:endonuclease domain-containing protein n=1 Tax=Mycolicibacterium rhodesiae TaxID=36814 RepID=UPI000DA1ECBE|nr:hypothetical protein [Mycolicibacterium rhodesiae]MCV7345398.1 hypothetical protein [Mycolicibacterium rhodesiae]
MVKLIMANEALAAGTVTRRDLRNRFIKVHRNVYAPRDMTLTAADRAIAAWMWSGRTATLAGISAAALLGVRWLPDDDPPELVRTQHRHPSGIVVHSGAVGGNEVCTVRGISCTTPARTAYDLGRRSSFTVGVIRVDSVLAATGVGVDAIAEIARRNPGARNIRRLRRVLTIADGGAESPQETRLRLLLVREGFPRPVTQIPIRNPQGRIVRRIDLGWPQWKVGIEYDGAHHWTDAAQHAGDIDRLEFLARLGWRIVRVSSTHLKFDRAGIVRRTRTALKDAGLDG